MEVNDIGWWDGIIPPFDQRKCWHQRIPNSISGVVDKQVSELGNWGLCVSPKVLSGWSLFHSPENICLYIKIFNTIVIHVQIPLLHYCNYYNEEWLNIFFLFRFIWRTSSLFAELWALRDSILMAWDLGVANLIGEVDALEVVSLLTNKSSNTLISLIINECRDALQSFSNFKLQHCYREGSKLSC